MANQNPLAGLWGSFQAAVNDPELRGRPGGIQQYVWASVRNDYLGRGEAIPAGAFQAVNQLLSLAGQQRRASNELAQSIDLWQRAGLDQALTSSHWSWDVNARDLNQQPLGPNGIVRFTAVYEVEGESVLMRLSDRFGAAWPQSVGDLIDRINESAAAYADEYDVEFAGITTDYTVTGW